MLKSISSLLFGILISSAGFSQDYLNDISVKYSYSFKGSNAQIIGLEYRKRLADHFMFKVGTEYARSGREVWLPSNIVYGSNSIIITRDQFVFYRDYNLNAGVDFERFKYFTFGGALSIGYKTGIYGVSDKGSRFNPETKNWASCTECVYEYYTEDVPPSDNSSINLRAYNIAAYTNDYLAYGFILRAGIKIPLGNRFEITSAYEPHFMRNKFLSTQKHNAIMGPLMQEMNSFNQVSHTLTAALRFRL